MLLEANNKLILLTDEDYPRLQVTFAGADEHRLPIEIEASDFIAQKSIRAKGKRLSTYVVGEVNELEPERSAEDDLESDEETEDEEVNEEDLIEEDEENARLLEEATGQRRLIFDNKDDEE